MLRLSIYLAIGLGLALAGVLSAGATVILAPEIKTDYTLTAAPTNSMESARLDEMIQDSRVEKQRLIGLIRQELSYQKQMK